MHSERVKKGERLSAIMFTYYIDHPLVSMPFLCGTLVRNAAKRVRLVLVGPDLYALNPNMAKIFT